MLLSPCNTLTVGIASILFTVTLVFTQKIKVACSLVVALNQLTGEGA